MIHANTKIRDSAVILLIAECRKVTLKNYAKSMGVSQQGTKQELATRIFENANQFTYQMHLPPGGCVSIGIALEKIDE